MDADTILINNFIDRACELADAVQEDIQLEGIISNETVVALAKFISALSKIEKVVDNIRANSSQLN